MKLSDLSLWLLPNSKAQFQAGEKSSLAVLGISTDVQELRILAGFVSGDGLSEGSYRDDDVGF